MTVKDDTSLFQGGSSGRIRNNHSHPTRTAITELLQVKGQIDFDFETTLFLHPFSQADTLPSRRRKEQV